MRDKRNQIALAVVLAIVAATAALVLLSPNRARILTDTGETRASVESSLGRLLPTTVESARDPRLMAAAEDLQNEPYVASVWVVDGAGNIVFHRRGPGKEGQNVASLAERDMGRALEGMAPGVLSDFQKLELLTVGAIRSEGEHNDVFRHLVRTVQGEDGLPAALVAVAYDVSPYVRGSGASSIVLTLVFLAGLAVYWLGLPLWVYLDASSRGEAAVLWGAFVLITNLVGLLAYLIVISKPRR